MAHEEPILYRNNKTNEDVSFITDDVMDVDYTISMVLFIPLYGSRKGKYCISRRDMFFENYHLVQV